MDLTDEENLYTRLKKNLISYNNLILLKEKYKSNEKLLELINKNLRDIVDKRLITNEEEMEK